MLPVLLYLVLPVLCFPELFLGQNTLYRADISWVYYPQRVLAAEQWKSGLVPLWNPYVLSGTPLLAEAEVGILQPLNALFLLPIPAYRALTLFVALNLTLAATSTYLLVRWLGISRVGATLAGLSFGFGGSLMAQITNLNLMTGGVWLPLVFWGMVWALRTHRPVAALLAGGPLALYIFAAHPELWLYAILLLIGYAIYETGRIALSPAPTTLRARQVAMTWVLLMLMLGSGLLLAAPQILPTWELQRLSVRSAGTEAGQAVFSIPPVQWITLALTSVFGNNVSPSYQGLERTNFEETYVYIGILPLLLVPFSWRARHRPEVPFLWLAALVGAWLAMGSYTPLYAVLQKLPGFNLFRAPARWSLVVSLALSLLAAFGLDAFLRQPAKRRLRFALVSLWVLIVVLILVAWLIREPTLQWLESLPSRGQVLYTLRLLLRRGLFEIADDYDNRILLGPLAWWVLPSIALISRLGVGVALLVAYSARRLSQQVFSAAVVMLVVIDLVLAGGSAVNRITGADYWQQLSGGARYILETEQGRTARFYAVVTGKENDMVAGLKYYFSSVHHLFGSGGHSALRLAQYDAFTRQAHPLIMLSLTGTRFVLNKGRLSPDAEAVLPLVYQDGEWYVYENPHALPRAFVARRAVAVSNLDEALGYVRNADFDPLSQLVLETQEALPPPSSHSEGMGDEIAITRYTPSLVEIQVNLTDSGFLVLLDNYYPGWRAYVNGQPATIMRAYGFARAVYVDGGRHTVRFVYRPLSFYGGLALAATALLILGATAWLTRRTRGDERISISQETRICRLRT